MKSALKKGILNQSDTVIHKLSAQGKFEKLQKLLESKPNSARHITEKNSRGYSPLHLACQNGHSETAMVLLENGAMPNAKDKFGNTPLYYAVFFTWCLFYS